MKRSEIVNSANVVDERGLGRVPDLTKTPSFFHSSAGIAPFAVSLRFIS